MNRFVRYVLVCVWGCALSVPVFAQTTTSTPAPTETITATLASTLPAQATALPTFTPAPSETPTPSPDETLGFTFSELGYTNLSISGGFGVGQFYLPIQAGYEASQDAQMVLRLSSSPLLKSVSSMTVNVNNQPVHSITLNAAAQTVEFTIPANLIRSPGLLLQFRAYLRVTDDDCEDSNIPSQWVSVLGESTITLYGERSESAPLLSELPGLFFSRDIMGALAPLVFVLPDDADTATVTAAARVAAGLAQLNADGGYQVEVVTVSTVTDAQLESSNLVLVGLPEQQADLFSQFDAALVNLREDGRFYTDDGQPVPAAHAVFEAALSPWNPERQVLVVSANTPQGLESAGLIAADQQTLSSLDGSYVFAARPIPAENRLLPPPWQGTTTSLEQLGFGARTIRGTGTISEYFTIYRPVGAHFGAGAQFVLRGSASPLLRNDQSYVAVFMNEIPLGAYAMASLIDQQTITFQIPSALDRSDYSQEINMRIEVSNEIPHEQCQTIDRENAWTIIDPSSSFIADFNYLPLPDLNVYPYPFIGSMTPEPIHMVLPTDYADHHVAGVVRAAFRLGFASQSDLDLGVISHEALDESAYDSHLIFLMDKLEPDINALFNITPEPVGEGTPTPTLQASILDGDTGELLDLTLYRALNEPFGLLYTDTSPVNPERTFLIVLSESERGMTAALDTLAQTAPLVSVYGTLAIVQEERSPYVLYRPEDIETFADPDSQLEATPTPTPEPQTPVSPLLSDGSASFVIIVIPIVMSLLLILAIWLLRRGRWGE